MPGPTSTAATHAGRAPAPSSPLHTVVALFAASHPAPCVTVTTIATAYAASAGAGPGRLLLLAAAVLTGQLSVGWSNDAIDAAKDRAAGRLDKPIAAGRVRRTLVGRASATAAVLTIALSMALGATAGALHLAAVALAVGYNARLKTTLASPLPYIASFGLLPVVAWIAAGAGGLPPTAHILAAALLGAAAHAGNTVGDAEADALTGVRGLPQRVGPQRSMLAMAVLVAAAAAVLLVAMAIPGAAGAAEAPGTLRRVASIAVLVLGAALAAAGAIGARRAPGGDAFGASRSLLGMSPFTLTLAAVGLVVAGFLLDT